ncbi:MAG: ABC transporter ATP-binding protein [Treponema sp.]|nr:ABC transporter ATP-binding protein [Treponema sp.]MBQ4235367.1 ABC transporter ATP-binding protein [Treponema sp.]MBQ5385328.1 ABC transporter ATP-binding protein [Treponema sp.]
MIDNGLDIQNSDMIVRIKGLEKTYVTSSEKLTILKNLDMEVPRGSKCVIVGQSGSGKSTLLNIIGGLDFSTSGTVDVDGKIISSMTEDELTSYRQKFLGLVFQFHYLLKDFTALENVFLPAYMAGVPKKEAMERARALIRDVGLENRAKHLPSQLSGGERQRVAVARCLVNSPELILADEPTGNLDPANAALIGELLFNLVDSHKKTLILVTHDMNLASQGNVRFFLKDGLISQEEG